MQTADGRRVHVQADARQLRGVASGMRVEVAGAFQAPRRRLAADGAAAPSAFRASSISASGGAVAAPQLTTVTAPAGGPSAAAAAKVVLSSNAAVTADVSTIVIPSEPRAQTGSLLCPAALLGLLASSCGALAHPRAAPPPLPHPQSPPSRPTAPHAPAPPCPSSTPRVCARRCLLRLAPPA